MAIEILTCPKCNAPIESFSDRCEYCGSIFKEPVKYNKPNSSKLSSTFPVGMNKGKHGYWKHSKYNRFNYNMCRDEDVYTIQCSECKNKIAQREFDIRDEDYPECPMCSATMDILYTGIEERIG